jgi:5-keto-L-gluconate epimerase
MKWSMVVSAQPSSFSALAYSGALTDHVNKVADLGFDGVELAVRNPELIEVEALTSLLRRRGLTVAAIGTGQAFSDDKLSLTDADAAIRRAATDRLLAHLKLASELDTLVIIGLIRGKTVSAAGRQQAEVWLADALRHCAAAWPNVRMVIEPINRYETELINTVETGLAFLDRIGADNVGLLLDTFHMNIEEASFQQSIRLAGERIFHFHVADSNRWYPGAGHIPFADILYYLKQVRYRGFVSAEILPQPDPDTAARETIAYFKKLKFVTEFGYSD